jgi:hypothetical protein
VRSIATAMDMVTWHRELRQELQLKGYSQAVKFTWPTAAEQVMSALEAAANG